MLWEHGIHRKWWFRHCPQSARSRSSLPPMLSPGCQAEEVLFGLWQQDEFDIMIETEAVSDIMRIQSEHSLRRNQFEDVIAAFMMALWNMTGKVSKFKAGFCIMGNRQTCGIYYFETSVVQWSKIRLTLVLSVKLGLKSAQANITAAFLHWTVEKGKNIYAQHNCKGSLENYHTAKN